MNISLRTKTIIGIGIIEAILLVSLISTVLFFMRSTSEQQLLQRVNTTTSLFATTTKDAVLSYDLASLEDFTSEVMKNHGMVYARVIGPDSNVFSEAGDFDILSRVFVEDKEVDNVNDGIFDSVAEISDNGTSYGRVEIGIDTNDIKTSLSQTVRLSSFIALVEIILVALFSFLLGGYLTGQLKHLRKAARDISDGKLDVLIPVKGGDEIAEVASAFNQMIAKLQLTEAKRDEYESELKALNQTLEAKVRRRTTTLSNKNTELTVAYDKLKEAQTRLLQSEKMASVGQLAAGVAHEINNPVGFISSNLESLREYIQLYNNLISKYEEARTSEQGPDRTKLNEEIKALRDAEDIDFVHEDIAMLLSESLDGTHRVRDIVQNLKGFSHIDNTKISPTDINQCLESTLKIANNEIKYKCEVVQDLQAIPLVECVAGQINQVLLNLIINASHAIGESGEITVSTRHIADKVQIQVRDNGEGIEDHNISKLFDPFFTTKPVGEGTGLGLSIVYGIIKDHDGEITVESELDVGTCFTVELPLRKAA